MPSDEFEKRLDEYQERLESADKISTAVKIFEEMQIYVSGHVDSEQDPVQYKFGYLYIMVGKLTILILKLTAGISTQLSNLEKRIDRLEIEYDIKNGNK